MANIQKKEPDRSPGTLLKIFRTLEIEFGPQSWWPAETPFEMIVGAVLTQNTSWKNVERAIVGLKRRRLLTYDALCRGRNASLRAAIRPAGYFNVKAKRLKNFVHFLKRHYAGDLDKLLGEETQTLRRRLLEVNGIGPETADSIVLYAAHKPQFVIDAYTRRIFSRYGLVSGEMDYQRLQAYFMDRLPKDTCLFNEYHALIVELAKRHCLAKPRCDSCPLRRDCRYAKRPSPGPLKPLSKAPF